MRLRFVSHPGVFNMACQYAQRDWATHVDVEMEDGSLIGAMSDGVKRRPAGYDAGKFIQEEYVVLIMTADEEAIVRAFVESQIGKPYDYGAIMSFFWPWRDWQDFGAWDCSELVAQSFVECGKFSKKGAFQASKFTPRDLRLLTSMITEAG